MSESNKSLISGISRKWKLEQIPTKKLEIENRLMEERLNQLKNELAHDKSKRSAQGGTIWSRAQPGPVTSYAKSILKTNDDPPSAKLSNRQLKLKVLKDEVIANLKENDKNGSIKEKKLKCGQCEKNLAFTKCLECGEDYCANCFTKFHIKGALQKHRTIPITSRDNSKSLSHSQSFSDTNRELSAGSQGRLEYNNHRINSSESTSSYNSNNPFKKPLNDYSLINGTYDEREAQESFKQAVLEWRNSGPNNKENTNENKSVKFNVSKTPSATLTSRDAFVGTDEKELMKQKYKAIENLVNANHTLSYAERMLVQKNRRNELNFDGSDPNPDANLNSSLKMSYDNTTNGHINFNDIMNAVNPINPVKDIDPVKSFNLKNTSVKIEELETKNNQIKPKEVNENLLVPELMETPHIPKNQIQYSLSRENSLVAKDKLPKTSVSRLNSARSVKNKNNKQSTTTSTSESLKLESNLTREPSEILKAISNRDQSFLHITQNENSNIGEFLMLDVLDKEIELTGRKEMNKPSRPSSAQAKNSSVSARLEPIKLSYKFYEMSPQSWHPSSSLSVNLKEIEFKELQSRREKSSLKLDNKLEKSATNSQIITNSTRNSAQILSKDSKEFRKEEESKTPTISKTQTSLNNIEKTIKKPQTPTKLVNKSLELVKNSKLNNIKNANVDRSPDSSKLDLRRHKSFVATIKPTNTEPKKVRPMSVTNSFILGNKQNIEFGNNFASYDIDDGRSSRICQNEEDDSYYGQLEIEFNSSIHRTINSSNQDSVGVKNASKNLPSEFDMKDLVEKLSKNMNTLEMSFRNDEYNDACDDLDDLDLEELKELN